LEDEDPHAAAAATAPRARPLYSSRRAGARPGRWMEIFTKTPSPAAKLAALLSHDYEEAALPDWRSQRWGAKARCHCRPGQRRHARGSGRRSGDPRGDEGLHVIGPKAISAAGEVALFEVRTRRVVDDL